MQGGPVLPAISEIHRHPDAGPPPHLRPIYAGPPITNAPQLGPPGSDGSPPHQLLKRAASQTPLQEESPAKKQSKWTPDEDNLTIELRGQGMKWDDIAKRLPGRSSISCRLRYQNYLEKRAVWDEEKKNKLARLYARFKDQMWQKVATEMGIPWRSAESMHWQLGEQEMSARANAPVFQLHPSATSLGSPPTGIVAPAPPHSSGLAPASHAFTATNAPQLVPHPSGPAMMPQQHLPPSQGPMHAYHQCVETAPHQGRKSSGGSFAQRRARSSVPPQLGPTLPQIHPQNEADLISGALSAPVTESYAGIKREGGAGQYREPFGKRRREEEADSGGALRPEMERSPTSRSPDRASQRSGTSSVKSLRSARGAKSAKRGGPDEPE